MKIDFWKLRSLKAGEVFFRKKGDEVIMFAFLACHPVITTAVIAINRYDSQSVEVINLSNFATSDFFDHTYLVVNPE